jgi:hypothetical protein
MSILTKILGNGGTSKLVDSISKGLDGIITTKEEKLQLENELNQIFLKDKQDARILYQKDPWLQKVYALVFLLGFLGLTAVMLWFVYNITTGDLKVPEWAIAFVSTIWGGMSTKVNTVTDFLFGSSRSSQQKNFSLNNFTNGKHK